MPEITIRPQGGTGISEEDLLPVGRHKVRVAEIVEVDNPFANPDDDPRRKTRLRILFEAFAGKHKGKMISAYSSPSMASKVTKSVITQLFGREPTTEELLRVDTDKLIQEADQNGRNQFLISVAPHTRKDGTPTVRVEALMPLGAEDEEE